MLIIFLLLSLIQAKALPASSFGPSALPYEPHSFLFGRASAGLDDRTLVDIVRSCIFTIFACVYRSIHPNIPNPEATWAQVQLERMKITLHALVVPEIIIFWAIRQWVGAGIVRDDVNRAFKSKSIDIKWTTTHGHFAQMGGFCREDNKFVITPQTLVKLIEEGRVNLKGLRLERKDIQDRSKGDLLSEGFIFLQTSWFLLECFVRWATHLPVTELEVITFAYAALNIATFLFWIRKPLNINRPNYLEVCDTRAVQTDIESGEEISEEKREYHASARPTTRIAIISPVDVTPPNPTNIDHLPVSSEVKIVAWGKVVSGFQWGSDKPLFDMMFTRVQHLVHLGQSAGVASAEDYNRFTRPLMTCFNYLLKRPLCLISTPFFDLVDDSTIAPIATYVPCYYGIKVPVERLYTMWWPAISIAFVFGAIHSAAWNSNFLTPTDQKLWRISSLIIVVIPADILLLAELLDIHDKWKMGRRTRIALQAFCFFLMVFSLLIVAFSYSSARVCLIVLALKSLSALPREAFTGIAWSSALPHF